MFKPENLSEGHEFHTTGFIISTYADFAFGMVDFHHQEDALPPLDSHPFI